MKNVTVCIITALLLLTCNPLQLKAITTATTPPSTEAVKAAEVAQSNALIVRLDDIKNLDKSHMSADEKRELRKETRSIKKQLRAIGQGVYLSAGAIVIIILLLVLLL